MGTWSRVRAWARAVWASAWGSTGLRGEAEAERELARLGYRILGRNIRVAFGEIDLLAEDPDGRTVVVVEVKARRRSPGMPEASLATAPEASVTRRKARKLVRLMDAVVRANGWESRPKRIDVVSVEFLPDGRSRVRHFRAAVGR
jgi:putative endonuclease